MSRPVLLLDCYVDRTGCAGNFVPALGARDIEVVHVPMDGVPDDPTAFSAVVVTGSSASVLDAPAWLPALEELLRRCVRGSVPVLGVCFGHQALASALAGRSAVVRRDRLNIGFVDVELDEHPLFAELPTTLPTFVTHFDEVARDVEGLQVIARGQDGSIQGLQVPGRPAWSVQFHPEIRLNEAAALLRKRAPAYPDVVPDIEAEVARGFDNDEVLARLLANFFSLVESDRPSPEPR